MGCSESGAFLSARCVASDGSITSSLIFFKIMLMVK